MSKQLWILGLPVLRKMMNTIVLIILISINHLHLSSKPWNCRWNWFPVSIRICLPSGTVPDKGSVYHFNSRWYHMLGLVYFTHFILVSILVCFGCKSFLTESALKWFFSSVWTIMILHSTLFKKPLCTFRTLIRLFLWNRIIYTCIRNKTSGSNSIQL